MDCLAGVFVRGSLNGHLAVRSAIGADQRATRLT